MSTINGNGMKHIIFDLLEKFTSPLFMTPMIALGMVLFKRMFESLTISAYFSVLVYLLYNVFVALYSMFLIDTDESIVLKRIMVLIFALISTLMYCALKSFWTATVIILGGIATFYAMFRFATWFLDVRKAHQDSDNGSEG